MNSNDRAAIIFGNEIDSKTYAKACKAKQKHVKSLKRDGTETCHLSIEELPVVGERFGGALLAPAAPGVGTAAGAGVPTAAEVGVPTAAGAGTAAADFSSVKNPVVIGNIRMGFGHYRIAMAMASAAHALGYTPLWFDLMGFPDTAATRLISKQNDLYSLGSRLSQKCWLFNKFVWEPINSEGFRKLTYNAADQKASELMVAPYQDLPRDIPFIGTHAWPAQAAVHAGLTNVVNAIPDNWPMALHLSEGAKHAVQTPSAYLGYKALRGMDPKRILNPMPEGSLFYTGHFIDHELVSNIPSDCLRRMDRALEDGPVRYLLSVGGAGAQQDLFCGIIEHLLPFIDADQAVLFVNVGDHVNVWKKLKARIPQLAQATEHFDDFEETAAFAEDALDGEVHGIHAFANDDIFAAVYSTNVLMRACDLLVTKPSELAYYPVPKLMIKRVGGHEAWGAIRAAEIGDGTYELETLAEICGMIDLMQSEPLLIAEMCDNIVAADAIGVYDGAYRVVQLACEE